MADSAERVDAALDYLRAVAPGDRGPARRQRRCTFELGAAWSAAVCPDVSSVVEAVDALMHRAPLN